MLRDIAAGADTILGTVGTADNPAFRFLRSAVVARGDRGDRFFSSLSLCDVFLMMAAVMSFHFIVRTSH